MKRVTGIGGIFFKCQDPEKLKLWYKEHLGFDITQFGAQFPCSVDSQIQGAGYTLWSPFSNKTSYFEPSPSSFMINYTVVNIEELVEQLKSEGVTVLDSIESYDFGKFVHILDLEGNKIELWEPGE